MRFTLDSRSDINLITGYATGEVRVGGRTLHAPCLIAADRIIDDWNATDVAGLAAADLDRIFQLQPQVVLLGTGARQQFPSLAIRQMFTARQVGLEVMDLGAACRTFNILVQEERVVIAALFPDG
jgi:uncharacterized protein